MIDHLGLRHEDGGSHSLGGTSVRRSSDRVPGHAAGASNLPHRRYLVHFRGRFPKNVRWDGTVPREQAESRSGHDAAWSDALLPLPPWGPRERTQGRQVRASGVELGPEPDPDEVADSPFEGSAPPGESPRTRLRRSVRGRGGRRPESRHRPRGRRVRCGSGPPDRSKPGDGWRSGPTRARGRPGPRSPRRR